MFNPYQFVFVFFLVACIFGGGVLVGYALARRDDDSDDDLFVPEHWPEKPAEVTLR